jgi:Cd2+/Zn2+-exporting ATPase
MKPSQRDLLFEIEGMDCAEEVAGLKRAVGPLVGGEERLAFDILNGRMAVLPGPVEVSPQAVARTGMRAEVWLGDEKVSDRGRFWQRHGRTVSTAASGILTLAGFLAHVWLGGGFRAALGSEGMGLAQHVPFAAKSLYTLAILAGAWYVVPKAWYAARRLRPA